MVARKKSKIGVDPLAWLNEDTGEHDSSSDSQDLMSVGF